MSHAVVAESAIESSEFAATLDPIEIAPPPPPASAPDAQPVTDDDKAQRKAKRNYRAIPTIAGSKSDDFVFSPRHSSFFNESTIAIGSEAVQKAFFRSYERCALALFEVDLIIPIIARNDDQANAVWEMTSSAMQKLSKWISNETAKGTALIEANSIACEGAFSKVQNHTVQVFSPQASQLLSLFEQMDELVLLNSRLWMASYMDNITYRRSCFQARVKIIHLAKEFWSIHARSIRSLYAARNRALQEANTTRDEKSKALSEAFLQNTDAVISKIEVREHEEREAGLMDPLGQSELEAEMGRSIEDAETATKPTRTRTRKTKADKAEDE